MDVMAQTTFEILIFKTMTVKICVMETELYGWNPDKKLSTL